MPCPRCQHSWPLHSEHGCSVPGCDCRATEPANVDSTMPDIPPARPGCCVHAPDGVMHTMEDCVDIESRLEGAPENSLIKVTCLIFQNGKQYTMESWIRPHVIGRFHEITDAAWSAMKRGEGISDH